MPFRRHGNIYRCFYCHDSFHLAKDLRDHNKQHDVDISLGIKNYRTSYSVKFDIADLKCKLCDKEFSDLKHMLPHLRDEHNKNCHIEDLQLVDYFKLSDDSMQCLICNETFRFFAPLQLHNLRAHKRRLLICELCGLSFSSKGSMSRHTQGAHATEMFKCRHCDKKFLAKHRRVDHEKRIHNVKERKCHICGEILGSTYKKDSHLASVHNYRAAEFKCPDCSKSFRFQNLLVKHNRRVHLKEKTKVCSVCGDKFFDNHLLGLHMVKHSDAKPFECSVCNKKFPRKRALEIHTRIHTNDRRFVCKLCGKAFVQTTSLKLHLRVHHGEKSRKST